MGKIGKFFEIFFEPLFCILRPFSLPTARILDKPANSPMDVIGTGEDYT
jgi:hypothetical protein